MIQSYLYTGAPHREKHIFCQDSVLSVQPYEDIIIAAVSDGCSNAPLSAIGSRLCVSSFVTALTALPPDSIRRLCTDRKNAPLLRGLVPEIIRRAVQKTGWEHFALSATFLGGLCWKNHAVLIHTGDGFATRQKGKKMDIVSPPENGSCQNSTFFITSPLAAEHTRVTYTIFDKLLLSTDGLSKAVKGKLPCGFLEPQTLRTFLERSQNTLTDDCGIILLDSQNNI